MKAAYTPKPNPGERHLHIRAMMANKLVHLMKTGKLRIPAAKKIHIKKGI